MDGDLANPELTGAGKDQILKMRQEKAADVEKRGLAIRDFQAAQENEIKDFTAFLRAGVVEEIDKVINFVTAGKFDMVMDSTSMPNPLPPNGRPKGVISDDLTDAVISALNKKADSPTPTAPVTTQKS